VDRERARRETPHQAAANSERVDLRRGAKVGVCYSASCSTGVRLPGLPEQLALGHHTMDTHEIAGIEYYSAARRCREVQRHAQHVRLVVIWTK